MVDIWLRELRVAARALARFPEVADLAEPLLAQWPVRAYAPQRLWVECDGFALTLLTGEAETTLAGMRGAFDAWFLDGFAPARNASMWSPAVFAHIARLSAPGARAATFSVAGAVRRGLEGRLELDVTLTTDGRLADIAVARSSGHQMLDEAAIEAAKAALGSGLNAKIDPVAIAEFGDFDSDRLTVPVPISFILTQ